LSNAIGPKTSFAESLLAVTLLKALSSIVKINSSMFVKTFESRRENSVEMKRPESVKTFSLLHSMSNAVWPRLSPARIGIFFSSIRAITFSTFRIEDFVLMSTCSQFHQHFTSNYFAKIPLPKKYKHKQLF